MASALQCPACGCKHRLSGLSGEPVFACAQCGRLLKTPAEYLRPEPSGPSEPPRPSASSRVRDRVQRGGSATRDRTSTMPAPGAAAPAAPPSAAAGAAVARPPRPGPRQQVPVALPLRIVAWIAAIVISAYIVRWFAKTIGWLTGDSLIDVITGSGIGRYFRVFALVPFWALAAALLATLFIEGGRAWSRRRSVTPNRSGKPPMRRVPPAQPPAKAKAQRPAGAKAHAPKQPSQPKPRPRQPAPRPAAANPPPAEPARPPASSPAAAETRSPSGAAGAPRPRRIPRRDITP